MEISRLKALLKNISSFFCISSYENLDSEPALKYFKKIEEILKLIKPVLNVIVDWEITSDEVLIKAYEELSQSVDELREIFESYHQLKSKVCFVLQVESLIVKLRTSGLDIFQPLKSYHQPLPDELSLSSLELCGKKFKHTEYEQISGVIKDAIKNQVNGGGPNSESLVHIADCLNLKSNEEILIEAVALEKLKESAEQAERASEAEYIDQLITVVTQIHDRYLTIKQSQSCSHVPIPPDFCCPLSLELMTDPVIVASGQTYERTFIRNWIDSGLTVCPKTRQTLAHTNLIPNYTVKALVANWCESNHVKLPEPIKPTNFAPSSPLHSHAESCAHKNSHNVPQSRGKSVSSSGEILVDKTGTSRPRSSSEDLSSGVAGNEHGLDDGRLSPANSEAANTEERSVESGGLHTSSPSRREILDSDGDGNEDLSHDYHSRSASASSTLSQSILGDTNEVSHASSYSSDASGEVIAEPRGIAPLQTRTRSQSIWRRPSERYTPRIVSSPAMETRPDLSGIEAEVRILIDGLKSTSLDDQRDATSKIRLLAKNTMDNRIAIANCGAISLLVNLLYSADAKIQENAVTALLNLSINDNNKTAIASAGAIEPLIHVLKTGSSEAKENAAATLFSLSVIEDNKVRIGRSGAIDPLVDLLGNGAPRGKKDAATALFNLSLFHENKTRIVQAGAVKYLVELMDPAAGMVDKAVAVLANLSTIPDGRTAIGQGGGIPVLVEVVELGSSRGKENAAAALLQLCTNSSRFCTLVLQEGAVPPLVALSQSGTARAKEKAQALLSYFRSQRQNNAGRG